MKLPSTWLVLFLTCFCVEKTMAQPTAFCDSALLVCDGLDGFTGTLNQFDVPQFFPGCPANAQNNPFWLAFVAGSTSISLLVTSSNCEGTNGQFGMQGGIYAGCEGPLVAAQCQCTDQPFELTYHEFKPGEVYYLLLDGCAGDVCDFQISVTIGSTESIPPAGFSLFGAAEICPGSLVEYLVQPGNMAGLAYEWSIEPPLGTLSGNSNSLVQVVWEQEGTADVCVFANNGCATTSLYCLSVLVEANPSEVSIAGDTVACLHSTSSYTALPAGCLGTNFSWSVEGGTLLSPPDSIAARVKWQTSGSGQICLSAVSSSGDTVETCFPVAVQPAFSALLAASTPAAEPQDSGWIQVCLGDTLFLTGATLEGQNVVQNDTGFQYQWLFSDGYFLQGKMAWRIFDAPGCYEMDLQVTPSGGCEATPFLGQRIRVVGGQVSVAIDPPAGICQGEQVVLQAAASNDTLFCASFAEFSSQNGLPIPDGNGTSLTDTLLIAGYPVGSVVTPGFLESICANMEHSWMRDLEIKLTCPNGQTVILHNHPGQVGGEVFLGEPNNFDEGLPNPIPGAGYDYCWTPDAANGTWVQVANQTPLTTLPPGNYASFQPLSNFTGCPVNGEWTLEVADLWPIDNGFLFSWSLEFAEPASEFFPVTTQVQWQPDSSLVSYSSTLIVAAPEVATTYFLAVSDNFGCEKLLEIPVEVFPENSPACLPCDSLTVEAGEILQTCTEPTFPATLTGVSSPEGDFMAYQWTLDGVVISQTKTVTITTLGLYVFSATNLASGCSDSDTLEIIEDTEVPIADAGGDVVLDCENPVAVLDGSNSSNGANFTYEWKASNGVVIGTGLTLAVAEPGSYTLCVIGISNGCISSDVVHVSDETTFPIGVSSTPDSCNTSIGMACAISTLPVTYLWSNGDTTSCIAGLPASFYEVTITYFTCETTASVFVDSLACTAAGEKFEEEAGFEIHPNPTAGNFTLRFHLPQPLDAQVNLLDVSGKKLRMLRVERRAAAGWQAWRFDASDLASGVYWLEIWAGEQRIGKRLLLM